MRSKLCPSVVLVVSLMFTPMSGATIPLSESLAQIATARNKGDLDVADSQAKSLLDSAVNNNDFSTQGKVLYQLARNAMERNDYLPAQDYLNRAITLFQEVDDQPYLGKTYRQLGLTYRYQANYSLSLQYLYMALAIFQSLQDEALLASIHNSLGVVLEKMGQFAEAAQYHQLALDANYAQDDQSGIASALYNLGDIRRTMGDFALARDYFRQSLAMDEAAGVKKDIAYSAYKLGYVSMQMGDLEAASPLMQRAHDIFTAIAAKRDIDWALSGLAELAFRQGRLTEAQQQIDGVLQRAGENGYNSLFVDAALIAADIHLAKNDVRATQAILDEGIEKAEATGEMHRLSQLLALKATASEKQNDLADAYTALKRQNKLELDAFNTKRLNAIASLQAQTEFVRRANQIELMQKDQALKEAQLGQARDERRMIVLGMLSVLIVGFLIYSRFIQNRYTHRLEREVAARTRELQAANQELQALSLTDKLTGLKNRRFFETQIDKDMQMARRQAGQNKQGAANKAQLSVYIIDLDHFKRINDTYGHAIGDEVLKHTAFRLNQVFRESDTLVRWGGEEFVAAARFTGNQEAAALAARIKHAFQQQPVDVGSLTVPVTCSIGFVCFPASCSDSDSYQVQDLLSMADSCLYAAKESGRNTWVGITDILDPVTLPLPTSLPALTRLVEDGHITASYEAQTSL